MRGKYEKSLSKKEEMSVSFVGGPIYNNSSVHNFLCYFGYA